MTPSEIEKIFRDEAGRALATLIRLVGDFDLAEEALQDAFAVALERWPAAGAAVQSAGLAGQCRAQQGDRPGAPADRVSQQAAAIDARDRCSMRKPPDETAMRLSTTTCCG